MIISIQCITEKDAVVVVILW